MTSNLGARAVQQQRARFARGWRRWLKLSADPEPILEHALHAHFDPACLN